MPGVSRNQIEQARKMSAFEYLQKYEDYDLKRCGYQEYELRSHDSFKINAETSKWHWKSRNIGGVSALDFLIHVRGQPFLETVRQLLNEHPCFEPALIPSKPKKVFVLPESAPGVDRAAAYLRSRGISLNVLRFCKEQQLFYEDIPYHNVVFVARDKGGVARFATKRGTCTRNRISGISSRNDVDASTSTTLGQDYKRDVEGSEKRFGCCMLPDGESDTVAIYESVIDAMSHATVEEQDGLDWQNKYRLAVSGIYAPKPDKLPSIQRPIRPPVALEQFLMDHPNVKRMEICTDNDFAGRYAAKHIADQYADKLEVVLKLPEPEGFDYNDMAVERMERSRQRAAER